MGEDYYALLGVARDASAEQIKRGYWTEAVRHHPDKNPGNTHAAAERFKKISEAYEVLLNGFLSKLRSCVQLHVYIDNQT